MLSPNELIEIYKIAAMAALFTSEDFRKSVDAHVKRFEQIEAQHKTNLARQLELHKHTLETQRVALQNEQEAWKRVQQEHTETQEKWDAEKQKIKKQHAEIESNLQQRTQAIHTRETHLAAQAAELVKNQTDIVNKAARLREATAALDQERRDMQTKLGKLKDLVK